MKKKEAFISIRIDEKEKDKIKRQAKQNGFGTISTYILWLIRKYSK